MSAGVCKKRDAIKKSLSDKKAALTGYGIELAQAGQKAAHDIANIKPEAKRRLREKVDAYTTMSWRRRRPDLALLVEILLLLVILVIIYYSLPYLTGKVKPGFTQEQFSAATKIPETAYSIEELAKVDLEVRALKDYAAYFNSNPYSLKNSGIYDLFVSVALLPLVMFFIMFVLPPFVLSYVVWFSWRFWPYVRDALWGWFLTMYNYFTTLIQGKLGCKWYIRWVTGWGCYDPDFNAYVRGWRNRYIDRPIYQQKLRYIQTYFAARKRYYEEPYDKYVTKPVKRYTLKAKYAKRIYVDRAMDVFLRKLQRKHYEYYDLPRDELYRQILGNQRYLAGVYAKSVQAKRQIRGEPYPGLTRSGKKCMCPATKTPAKLLEKGLKEQGEGLREDLEKAAEVGKRVYDKVAAVEPCELADKVIEKRSGFLGWIIAACILAAVGYLLLRGRPDFLQPTTRLVIAGSKIISESRSYYSRTMLYAVIAMVGLLLVW